MPDTVHQIVSIVNSRAVHERYNTCTCNAFGRLDAWDLGRTPSTCLHTYITWETPYLFWVKHIYNGIYPQVGFSSVLFRVLPPLFCSFLRFRKHDNSLVFSASPPLVLLLWETRGKALRIELIDGWAKTKTNTRRRLCWNKGELRVFCSLES